MSTLAPLFVAGIVLGSMYALASLGLVLIYRTSGVINFAQGAMGMFGTFIAWQLIVQWGWPKPVGVLIAVAFGALLGYVVERFTIRPVPGVLPRTVVTLGWLLLLQAGAGLIWGFTGFHDQIILFPIRGFSVAGFRIGIDQVALVAITAGLVAGLAYLIRATAFGISLRAVSDDISSARLVGIRTTRITAGTWALGGALAVLAGILLSPSQPLDTVQLTLLITQAYAAAMVGRLVSLPLTFAGAMVLGLLQSIVPSYWSSVGVRELLAVLLMIAAVWTSSRERLASRFAGGWQMLRSPRPARFPSAAAPSSRARLALRGSFAGALGILVIALSLALPSSWSTTFAFAAAFSLAALSVVLLTGYVGQISLAQAAFMGFGAFLTGKLVVQGGLSFWLAMPLAALATAAVGVVVGLPSLRARGLHLAVVTLATGVAFDRFVFQRPELISTTGSWSFERPHAFGASLGSDRAWFFVCLVFLVAFMWAAANLRRSKTGKLLAAVQESETAAGSLGWHVARLKLLGFGISAFVAGCAGALVAGTFEGASAAPFDFRQSITLVAVTVIAGVRSISAVAVAGTLRYVLPRFLHGGAWVDVITGGLLIVQFLTAPGGISSEFARLERLIWGLWKRRREPRAHEVVETRGAA
jgi:branched-chain amino acid transport system permease protein